MAVQATLTFSPIPATPTQGGAPMVLYHIKVTTGATAGTYKVPHGLTYTPTIAIVIPNLAEGTVPAVTNACVAFCSADTDGTNIGFNVAAAGTLTYDILYG